MTPFEVVTVRGHALPLVRVPGDADRVTLGAMLQRAGLPIGGSVVVLVGGADRLTREEADVCEATFNSSLVPVLEELPALLVDGGTHSGIMRLAGRARCRAGARSPHIGVVAVGTVRWPCEPGDATADADRGDLDPQHSHFVAVPGHRWGDEGRWMSDVAAALSDAAASVTVLANGGDIAYVDVLRSLEAGRPVLVLGGTGRAADEIAHAVEGRPADPRAVALARSPLVIVVPDDPGAVRTALTSALLG